MDIGGTRQLLGAAGQAGVAHFLYVSIVGVQHARVPYSRIMTVALALMMLIQPFAGRLSDHIGRKPLMVAFGALGTLLTYPIFATLERTRDPLSAFAVVMAALVIVSGQIVGDKFYIAHVGDSRCYRVRAGAIQQMTRDHSLLEDYKDAKPNMSEEEQRKFPHKNGITRALGMRETVQVGALVNSGGMSDTWKQGFVDEIVRGLTDPAVGEHAATAGPEHAQTLGWEPVAETVGRLIAAGDPSPGTARR